MGGGGEGGGEKVNVSDDELGSASEESESDGESFNPLMRSQENDGTGNNSDDGNGYGYGDDKGSPVSPAREIDAARSLLFQAAKRAGKGKGKRGGDVSKLSAPEGLGGFF